MICFPILEIYRGYVHISPAQNLIKILKINLFPPFPRKLMCRISQNFFRFMGVSGNRNTACAFTKKVGHGFGASIPIRQSSAPPVVGWRCPSPLTSVRGGARHMTSEQGHVRASPRDAFQTVVRFLGVV